MGSLLKAAIAAYVVFSTFYPQPIAAEAGADMPQSAEPFEVVSRRDMKHPSSREYVGGPWPRFVKKMLA